MSTYRCLLRSLPWGAALCLVGASCAVPEATAEVRLPPVFSDGLVVQRGLPVRIWGSASPGESVTVELGGRKGTRPADADGRWEITLAPFEAGGPHSLAVSGAENRVVVSGVLVGEVWLCGGQSNMAMPTRNVIGSAEIETVARPDTIRLLYIPRRRAADPAPLRLRWQKAAAQEVGRFPAVCYLFGQRLQQHLKVPVGLIAAAVGGTAAETWMSADGFGDPQVRRSAEMLDRAIHSLERRHLSLNPDGKSTGSFYRLPSYRPSELFETMIRPVVGYTLRGVAWYQGESHGQRTEFYRPVLEALIRDWRQKWNSPHMPFLIVQLPGFGVPGAAMEPGAWVSVRETQSQVARSTEGVGMVVTLDCGGEDIHPKNKLPIAERLARAARAVAYGEKIRFTGPVVSGHARKNDAIEVAFSSFDGRLVVKGERLAGFFIAGADRRWVEAEAVISGNRVLLRHADVPAPEAVRYGWSRAPLATLFDSDGLPAGPFRTDDW